MKTLSRTIAIITGLVAGLVWPAAATERQQGDEKSGADGSARFGAAACRVPQDGHVQFANGRDPFKGAGGGGSYSDIFFASGAGTRVASGKSGGGAAAAPAARQTSGGAAPAAGGSGTSSGSKPPVAGGSTPPVISEPIVKPPVDPIVQPGHRPIGQPPGPGIDSPVAGPVSPQRPRGVKDLPAATPEPGSAVLLGTGLIGMAFARFGRRRRRE